jgi:hypothetical protein
MDPDEFRRLLCQALDLSENASEYAILAEVEAAYHFYVLHRPAIPRTTSKPTRPFSLDEASEWIQQYPEGTKILITGITPGHATDLVQEFYGAEPHPCLETGSAGAWITVASQKDVYFLDGLFEAGYRLEVREDAHEVTA